MPARYLERHRQYLNRRAPKLPQYEQKIFRDKVPERVYYDQWRPWQIEHKRLNQRGRKNRLIFVEPLRNASFYHGDRCQVMKGPEKGKQGIINYIVRERNWVYLEGINLERSVVASSEASLGMIECREKPLLMNHEVKLVDPSDLEPTDVEWQYDDLGNKVRVSTRTGTAIPFPKEAYSTVDYTEPESYAERSWDTPAKLVTERTYTPQVKTFEMDICDEMGIKDERVPYPMFWY